MKYIKKLKRLWRYPFYFLCVLLFFPVGALLKRFHTEYRDVWLIAERGKEARDNGYHLFRFIREYHPEVNAYYVIDKKSSDFDRVAALGKTVQHGSLKHHLLFAASTYKISTHIAGYAPDILCYNRLDHLGLVKGKKVFLQHGIIKDNLTWLYYPNAKVDLFVCGAYPEYLDIREHYGHPEGVVQYLGLCRYDRLLQAHETRKWILFMPTWRVYLDKMTPSAFMRTEYYQKLQSLLSSKQLAELLEKYDYQLMFLPHFDVLKFLSVFSAESSRIHLCDGETLSVQELLMTSEILITDYSSVFFDFAYMGKPELFYQFDESEYREKHYVQGYFDYRRDGFGPVLAREEEVLEQLDALLNGTRKEEEARYQERANAFFQMRDDNNCRRNFEAMIELSLT